MLTRTRHSLCSTLHHKGGTESPTSSAGPDTPGRAIPSQTEYALLQRIVLDSVLGG